MKKLVIKTKGLFIHIPGFASCRTPVSLDISEKSIGFITTELKKLGIDKFEIVDKNEVIASIEKQYKTEGNTSEDNKNFEKIISSIEDQKESINKIENLLRKFLETGLPIQTKDEKPSEEVATKTKKIRKKIDETIEDFIPEIKIDNFKLKGLSNTKNVQSEVDLSKRAKSLQDLNKGV